MIDREIAGYVVSLSLWKKEEDPARKNLLLFDIEVISKYRRFGVASLLIEALKKCGAENGYENIYSESRTNSSWNSDNSAGISLFLKTGAIELINIDIMKAVFFCEENAYKELPNDSDDNDEIKSYKWKLV